MGIRFHGYYEMLSSEICQFMDSHLLFLWIILCLTLVDVDLLNKEIDKKLKKPPYMKKKL